MVVEREPTLTLVVGYDGSESSRAAVSYAADRVGPGGSGGEGRIGALLGSVARQVLHTADRPVVVIPHQPVREPAEVHI